MTTTSGRSDPAPRIELAVGMSREEIYGAYGLTCPPRVATLRDPSRPTYGRAVARIAARLGTPFMPWQRYSVDVALELDPQADELAYREVRILVPRQSGKTTEILAVKVHRALAMGREARRRRPSQGIRQKILYAAQKLKDAREKFVDDHIPVLEASEYRSRFRKRLANGSEHLLWDTGCWDGITANGETSGHGKVLDLGVEDEAFAATDNRLEAAFSPAMITRWSPQHWVISTEGTEKSTYLADKVDTGREIAAAGERSSICYLEWSNLDGARNDPATWLSCMPALCPTPGPCRCDPAGVWRHTVTVATIRSELEKMASRPDEFDRAYLNRRKRYRPPVDPLVPSVEEWEALVDLSASPGDAVAFFIDTNPLRTHTSIVMAGARPDGLVAVELVAYGPGTDWVPAWVVERQQRWNPVAWGLDGASAANALLTPLEDAGIRRTDGDDPKRGELMVLTARDAAGAFGLFVDAVRGKGTVGLRHRGDERLRDALMAARSRPLGDGTAWARRASDSDISPIVGATGAVYVFERRKHLAQDEQAPNIW